MEEAERPETVIFLIQTDGQENASRKHTLNSVKSMISEQQDKYSWEFVSLDSNIDAVGWYSEESIAIQGRSVQRRLPDQVKA